VGKLPIRIPGPITASGNNGGAYESRHSRKRVTNYRKKAHTPKVEIAGELSLPENGSVGNGRRGKRKGKTYHWLVYNLLDLRTRKSLGQEKKNGMKRGGTCGEEKRS